MSDDVRFSERHDFAENSSVEIRIRYDAPRKLRGVVRTIADNIGIAPHPLRDLVCGVLQEVPDESNWSAYPNVFSEVLDLLNGCEWYEVYDVIEEISKYFTSRGESDNAREFSKQINRFFVKSGIGWQLVEGQVEIRGPEAFEAAVSTAVDVLEEANKSTAKTEIHKALQDLSRRPMPDSTGAIQHAMAALECVARDVTGNPKATLGEILKKSPGLIPAPLDAAVEKTWGFASERGRHLREGREPTVEEAELVVGLASVVATFLSRKEG